MDYSKGNIMNRMPKQHIIRDKNYTLNQNEELKTVEKVSFKEQKLQEIAEHRRKILIGSR